MLRPKEIKELLVKSEYANMMSMIIYLFNSGGEERFLSWYNLYPQVHKKVKAATDHYSWLKKDSSKIKWFEEEQQFVYRDYYYQKMAEAELKEQEALKEQEDNKSETEQVTEKEEHTEQVTEQEASNEQV